MKKHIKPRPDCQQKKWNSKVKGLPFPSDIVRLGKLLNLTKEQRLFLLILLASMNTKNRKCWKSQAELAEEMGCRRGTVGRVSACLEERGIIRVKNRERIGRRHEYSFRFPWPASISMCPEPDMEPMCSEPDMHVPPTGHDHVPLTGHGHVPPTGHYNVTTQWSELNGSSSSMGQTDEDDSRGPGQEDQGENLGPAPHDQLPFSADPVGWTRRLFVNFDPRRETVEEFFAGFRNSRLGGLDFTVFRKFRSGDDFREMYGLDLDEPRSRAFEDQLEHFVEALLRYGWRGDEIAGAGIRKTIRRAGRFGLLSVLGFSPISEEERARQEEELRREREEAQAEDERKEEMERRLLEFCYQDGPHKYLQELGLLGKRTINLDRVRAHIRELKAEHGFKTTGEIKAFMTDHVEALTARRERNANLRDFSKMLSERPELYAVLTKLELLPGDVLPELLNRDEFGKAFDRFNSLADEHGFQSFEEISDFIMEKAENAA